jgi:hypothetical protein
MGAIFKKETLGRSQKMPGVQINFDGLALMRQQANSARTVRLKRSDCQSGTGGKGDLHSFSKAIHGLVKIRSHHNPTVNINAERRTLRAGIRFVEICNA